jgi:hypothetical protein
MHGLTGNGAHRTEKCQLRTEKCQLRTEKCQFRTEKCQWLSLLWPNAWPDRKRRARSDVEQYLDGSEFAAGTGYRRRVPLYTPQKLYAYGLSHRDGCVTGRFTEGVSGRFRPVQQTNGRCVFGDPYREGCQRIDTPPCQIHMCTIHTLYTHIVWRILQGGLRAYGQLCLYQGVHIWRTLQGGGLLGVGESKVWAAGAAQERQVCDRLHLESACFVWRLVSDGVRAAYLTGWGVSAVWGE